MSGPQTVQSRSGSPSPGASKEEWEEWEDDEVLTPITATDGPLLGQGPVETKNAADEAVGQPARQASRRTSGSTARQSMQKIRRLRSRQRQKAQNARVGIKLDTDMSKFRQQQQQQQQQQKLHIAHQLRRSPGARESRTGKFVDPAALRALEGAPSDDSIGTFAWLKRKPTKGKRVERLISEASTQPDLSPSAGPIVIGFAMPSDSDVVISPQTAVVETPVDFPPYFKPAKAASPNQPVSAWSPDTEDGASPRELGVTSIAERSRVPAVPSIPRRYKPADVSPITASDNEDGTAAPWDSKSYYRDTITTPIYVSDDDDMGTPVTLFEEDGSPATTRRKSLRLIKGRQRSATAGSSRSQGWWDQVTSPFGPPTPATPQQSPAPSQQKTGEGQTWWRDVDRKKPFSPTLPITEEAESSSGKRYGETTQHYPPEIIVQDVSFPAPSSSQPGPAASRMAAQSHPTKPRVLAVEQASEEVRTPGELPPPYSPPKAHANVRYRAVFPPGHPLNNMYPPSPGPVPPGLSHTMTSQGAIGLADVPLTPSPASQQPRLPDRPPGSFVPSDHYADVSGHGPRQKAERQRRRHEKEDVVAWKAGRLWHGRGCFPCCGCLGRPGREGRKRRRVCLGVCLSILILAAVGVTLGVLLSRQKAGEASVPSRFLNLTNFPPIPTGISTVIGPDSDATTACIQPPTLWTCSLPKEQADSVAPFDASQPSFVIHIQFDNDTRQLWNVTGQEPPRPTPVRSPNAIGTSATSTSTQTPRGAISAAVALGFLFKRVVLGRQEEPGSILTVKPEPPPPSFQEIFFLGNTTDGVVSDDKAGEPTPFYISMLRSINDTAGPNVLTRRDGGRDDGGDDGHTGTLKRATNSTTGQSGGSGSGSSGDGDIPDANDTAPPPHLDKDGTGAPAVLLGFPTQQPLRLYDRGLPTERYGFYSYFNKTTYVTSLDANIDGGSGSGSGSGSGTDRGPAADQNGGSLKSEAKFLVTWLSVRYKVEIWTRMGNTSRLLGNGIGGSGGSGGPAAPENNGTRPGSFPYPVTVTLDTHGGPRGAKFVFSRGVDRGRILLGDAKFLPNRVNTTGDVVNPAGDFNDSFGGIDGGTGGCKCEYRNWVGVSGGGR